MTEQMLIEGCIREDAACQKQLFELYAEKMMAVCLRYARHRLEAEDMLQESFVRIFDHIGTFEFKGALEGWIRRIVVNTALRFYQRKHYAIEQPFPEQLPDIAAEPEAYASLSEQDLLKLIASLPEGYRLVFNLYAIEGYNHKEIAEMLDIQESTSRSQLVKARKMLQSQLLNMQRIAV